MWFFNIVKWKFLENVYNSINQYFTGNQCMMLQNQSYMCNRSIQNARQTYEF